MSNIFYGIQKLTGYKISYGCDLSCHLNIIPNASINDVERYEDFKGIHLIRDSRDIVVSGYFSHLKTHPPMGWERMLKHRENLKHVSMEEGFFLEMDWLECYFNDMLNWNYENHNILELRFETITQVKDLQQIIEFLNLHDDGFYEKTKYTTGRLINKINNKNILPFRVSDIKISKKKFQVVVNNNSFKKLSGGRVIGVEDNNSHYRKGSSGDWKLYFNEKHKNYFKSKYGEILKKLKYEKDDVW